MSTLHHCKGHIYTACMTVYDHATESFQAIPMKTHDAFSTTVELDYLRGDLSIRRMHSDSAGDIIKACRRLGIVHERATPGHKNSNAIIEQQNGELEADVRVMLFEAGAPDCWWTYCAPCRCFLRNRATFTDADGHFVRSAWQRMYDTDDHWGGHAIPWGAGVWY